MDANPKLKWMSFCVSMALALGLAGCASKSTHQSPFSEKRKPAYAGSKASHGSIRTVIKSGLSDVQDCYNSLFSRSDKKSGRLVVTWFVDSQGRASQFQQALNELESDEIYHCTKTAIESWSFPPNQATLVRYTFKMRTPEKRKLAQEAPRSKGVLAKVNE